MFGQLDLHGTPRDVYWTRLNATVEAGGDVLTLEEETDWMVWYQICFLRPLVVFFGSMRVVHCKKISQKISMITFNTI